MIPTMDPGKIIRESDPFIDYLEKETGAKVELVEQIRREYEVGVGTIAGVARKLGVHRRMVRERRPRQDDYLLH